MIRKLILLFLCIHQLEAAGPIMHVVLGEKWLAEHSTVERKAFLLGTLFPDIRYLGEVDRESTHFVHVEKKEIEQGKNAFEAGMLLHSYVDEKREERVEKWGIYDRLPAEYYSHRSWLLKLVEDEILFDLCPRDEMVNHLYTILEEEKAWEISKGGLVKWHASLMVYFSLRPSTLLFWLAKTNQSLFGLPREWMKEWSALVKKLAKEPEMITYVADQIKAFE